MSGYPCNHWHLSITRDSIVFMLHVNNPDYALFHHLSKYIHHINLISCSSNKENLFSSLKWKIGDFHSCFFVKHAFFNSYLRLHLFLEQHLGDLRCKRWLKRKLRFPVLIESERYTVNNSFLQHIGCLPNEILINQWGRALMTTRSRRIIDDRVAL